HYFSKLSPEYAYDKLFIASRDGVVRALDPTSGKQLWSQNVKQGDTARLSGGLTAAYGHVYIGSENGDLIALDEANGEVSWRISVVGEILAKPVAENGL
ncbi:outer membrane protein assembly factor BamB, partial [Vibrio vulnificus]